MTSGGNNFNDFSGNHLTKRHRQVAERQLSVVERQTHVAERRSGTFRLNSITVQIMAR